MAILLFLLEFLIPMKENVDLIKLKTEFYSLYISKIRMKC